MASKSESASPAELLTRLEGRHDQLLGQLDELNERIEAALESLTEPAPAVDG